MEQSQRNKKGGWRIRQYRSLIFYILLCLIWIEGQAVEKASPLKQQTKSSKTQSKTLKKSQKKKQIVSKRISKTRNLASKTKVIEASSVKTTNSKKTKHKIAADKKTGYRIPHKTKGLFGKMKLKKGDVIQSINGKSIQSKRQIHKKLSLAVKKQKRISLLITRNKKDFLISYKIVPHKTKSKILISNVQKLKGKTYSTKQRRIAAIKNKKSSKTKQTLVPEKYKAHLQRAYVVALNSFIYKKPDFDAPQLYALSIGEKVLISKKIFRPSHNFGSFYKILLFRPKKIIGYVAETEVVPEFLKREDKYEINPAYNLAKKQMKDDKALDIDLIDKVNQRKQLKQALKNNKRRYVGLSLGLLTYPLPYHFEENILVGLKFSGYNLLIPSINIDFNFTLTPYNFDFFHFDILAAYPLLKLNSYHLFIMGGLKFDIDRRIQNMSDQNNPGAAGALALIIPISQKFLFRLDAKAEYGLSNQSFSSSVLSSLQIAF